MLHGIQTLNWIEWVGFYVSFHTQHRQASRSNARQAAMLANARPAGAFWKCYAPDSRSRALYMLNSTYQHTASEVSWQS